MENKKTLLDKINDFTQKVAAPMSKFAKIPCIQAIQSGLIAATPIIIIGSIYCVLFTFASPSIGDSGSAILGFLEPYAGKLILFNSLTIGLLAFYCSITIAHSYANILGVETLSATLLGVSSFLLININDLTNGISTNYFGATGLITSIIVTLIGIKLYKFLMDKKIIIKLPDSVPSNVLNAFTSLIPYFVVLTLCWIIRSLLDFNLSEFISVLIAPIIKGGDNIGFFSLMTTMHGFFWSVGLHWDNMTSSVVEALTTIYSNANAEAFVAGTLNADLPYIYTQGLYRITVVPAIFYPPLILMLVSKLKQLRTLGFACLPAAIFGITEPITFGLLVFNPFLAIPMILSGLIGGIITYGATALGLVAKFHAILPWATPTFLYGIIGTGSISGLVIQLVVIAVGLLIYYPFFKAYEANQIKEVATEN